MRSVNTFLAILFMAIGLVRPVVAQQPAVHLEPLDATTISAIYGSAVPGRRAAVVSNSTGQRVSGWSVTASSGFCNGSTFVGRFGSNVILTSDSTGVVTTPDWIAPPPPSSTGGSDGGGLHCTFTLVAVNASGYIQYDVTVSNDTSQENIARGTSPTGGQITLSATPPPPSAINLPKCKITSTEFLDPAKAEITSYPANLALPHGLISFSIGGGFCGTSGIPIAIDFPSALPPTTQWWAYAPPSDGALPTWYPMPSQVEGNRITFVLSDGGPGDRNGKSGGIQHYGMPAVAGGIYQDLWWSGSVENGWGMTIVQHRDVLFANVFVYDAQGRPTWYVMPSGSWDSSHTIYTGALYLPAGSPYFNYDASRFTIGASVGTARLMFASANAATFDYTINGISGSKSITRIPFGPRDVPGDIPVGDLWWAGSAQNGWGLAIIEQSATLFALWFTYDANGKATWFVMPNVQFVSRNSYRGSIDRPEGPPWLGVPYDASRHRTVEVGSFNLRFDGEGGTFAYSVDGNSGVIPISRIPF